LDTEISSKGVKGYSLVEYTNHQLASHYSTFEEQLFAMEQSRDLTILPKICETPTKNLLSKLSPQTKIDLVEAILVGSKKAKKTPLAKLVLEKFEMQIMVLEPKGGPKTPKGLEGIKIAHTLYNYFKPKAGKYSEDREKLVADGSTRVYGVAEGASLPSVDRWFRLTNKTQEEAVLKLFVDRRKGAKEEAAEESKFGLFGILDQKAGKLRIKQPGKGSGMACSSWKTPLLIEMLINVINYQVFPINEKSIPPIFNEKKATTKETNALIAAKSQIENLLNEVNGLSKESLKAKIAGILSGGKFNIKIDDSTTTNQMKNLLYFMTVAIGRNQRTALCYYVTAALKDAGALQYV